MSNPARALEPEELERVSLALVRESAVLVWESAVLVWESAVLVWESAVLVWESVVLVRESAVLVRESAVLVREPAVQEVLGRELSWLARGATGWAIRLDQLWVVPELREWAQLAGWFPRAAAADQSQSRAVLMPPIASRPRSHPTANQPVSDRANSRDV